MKGLWRRKNRQGVQRGEGWGEKNSQGIVQWEK